MPFHCSMAWWEAWSRFSRKDGSALRPGARRQPASESPEVPRQTPVACTATGGMRPARSPAELGLTAYDRRMTGTAGWRPLVEGESREHALRVARELAESLEEHARRVPLSASLSGGAAGLALLFTWLDRVHASAHDAVMAERLLGEAMDAVASRPMGATLYSGMTGVAWAVEHLTGGGEEEEGNGLEDVDAVLARRLGVSPWTAGFDLISGLAGLGVYALERLPRADARRCLEGVVSRLAELAEERPEGLTWKTQPQWLPEEKQREQPHGRYDLGVAHGVPGLIPVLAGAVRAGVAVEHAWRLLRGAWNWVMAQRLPQAGMRLPHAILPDRAPSPSRPAWCYGDVGASLAMHTAARAVGEATWKADALAMAQAAASSPVEDSGVTDVPLCHGAAGLLHVYNRLYQATGEEVFATAARRWLEITLRQRQPGQGIGGYAYLTWDDRGTQVWAERPGLLEGTAGIALALLAAASSVEPTWDRVLLMSLRGVQ
ncbi:Lanthionine biosynthesis cyclase LanC [Corallococcus interemptor]|uniref:Lanthionine biosynthesis cyclase LanC n=2 Tax=Corallococcus interemptor TaxID=2316720 RepID=A0A3A8QZ35_9BACT|nr:Lanthionine biosynthesis cyclase LanC [Corallococcus interemptor]